MRNFMVKAIAIFIAAARVLGAPAEEPVYRMVPWADVSDRHLSELAKFARDANPDNLYYAESSHLIVYAHTIRDIDMAMTQAEFAWTEIARLLNVADTGRKAHLFLIGTTQLWDELVAKAGLRPDGLALQVGREIFIKGGNQVHISRIPHEVMHFRLRDTYGSLPLWLDEGMALHYGWRVAKAWADEKGLKISRSMPAIPADRMLSLDVLTSSKQYPATVGEAQAYYRQAEELSQAIIDKIGLSKAGDFLKSVASDGLPWRVSLAEQFGFSDADFGALEKTVREKSGVIRDD